MIASTLVPDARLQPIFGLARLQPLGDELVRRYRRLLGAGEPAVVDAHHAGDGEPGAPTLDVAPAMPPETEAPETEAPETEAPESEAAAPLPLAPFHAQCRHLSAPHPRS